MENNKEKKKYADILKGKITKAKGRTFRALKSTRPGIKRIKPIDVSGATRATKKAIGEPFKQEWT